MSDLLFWLAANVEFWRPFAYALLAAFVIGAVMFAVASWDTLS